MSKSIEEWAEEIGSTVATANMYGESWVEGVCDILDEFLREKAEEVIEAGNAQWWVKQRQERKLEEILGGSD